jgi:pimeloyl-ACP methyl ester carboxylesterase
MPQTVEDIEAVRKALGYPRIDLLSESYGTRLAYIYGLMHPESIHRSVMIGVNPPGHFTWDPQLVDEQLNYYSRLWSKDSIMARECPDLASSMRRVLQNMPRKWLFFSISPGKVKVAAFGLLFHRNTAAMVFDAFVAAEHGDASGIALMSLAYGFIIPSMSVWGDLASKALSADFDSTRDYGAEPDRPEAILGSPMNRLLWTPLRYGHVPVQMIPKELRTPQPSDVNTLLVSGSLDFSTPAEIATRELLPLLRNGRQIVLSEFGHVGDVRYLRQNRIESIVSNYFDTGIADTSEIEYVPMDFHVGWGFPRIAKVAMGAILLLCIGLISGMVWISKKTL